MWFKKRAKKPTLYALGAMNETFDNCFVPLFDYDNTELRRVIKDVFRIQKTFGLGDMVVVRSRAPSVVYSVPEYVSWSWFERSFDELLEVGNYSVWGFDKLSYGKFLEVTRHTRCDRNWVRLQRRYKEKSFNIRITAKLSLRTDKEGVDRPEFLCLVKADKPSAHEKSYAHFLMVKKAFNAPIEKGRGKWDEYSWVENLVYYT